MSKLSNLLIGTAIGGILGVLFAPDKGENTRRKLRAEALTAKDKLAETADEVKKTVGKTYAEQKENLEAQLESVMSNVSYKADDVILALEKKLKDLRKKNKDLQKKNGTNVVDTTTLEQKA